MCYYVGIVNERGRYMKSNKYSVEEIYDYLYRKNFEEFEKTRTENTRQIIRYALWIGIMLVGVFVSAICEEFQVSKESHIYGLCGCMIIIGFLGEMITAGMDIKKRNDKYNVFDSRGNINHDNLELEHRDSNAYREGFKEKIIKPLIEYTIAGTTYNAKAGLSKQEYENAWGKTESYSFEDEIIIELETKTIEDNKLQLIMSQALTTEKEYIGLEPDIVTNNCLAGHIELTKNIGAYIKILNGYDSAKNKENIKMDMANFEEIFNVETNDKIKATQLLTADVMSELVKMRKSLNFGFDIFINYNILHIRFNTGQIFEAPMIGKSIQLNELKYYHDTIEKIKYLIEYICNVIMITEL